LNGQDAAKRFPKIILLMKRRTGNDVRGNLTAGIRFGCKSRCVPAGGTDRTAADLIGKTPPSLTASAAPIGTFPVRSFKP